MPNPAPEPSPPSPPDLSDVLLNRPRREPQARETRGNVGWILLLALIGVPATLWASASQIKQLTQQFFGDSRDTRPLVSVDRGEVRSYVVEGGTLESADKALVRCKVEAVLGTVTSGGQNGQNGRTSNQTSNSATTSTSTTTAAAQTTATTATTTATGTATAGAAASAAQAVAAGQTAANATAQAAGAAQGQAAATAASAGSIIQKPAIKSFTMTVPPHVPLRPATTAMVTAKTQKLLQQAQQQQNGDANQQPQKQGSTTILKILPEGTQVKAGDIVCWLDSAAFEEELKSQKIRYFQAKSWVEQAEYALNAAQIALDEYKNGIYPQDLMLIEQYIHTCKISLKQARTNLDWEISMLKKSLRTISQAKGAQYELQRAELALREAENMRTRLVAYTKPKLATNLEAKIAAVTADLEAQNAAFTLEKQRKEKLERAIANCLMRAPRDGSVVYYVKSNGWGRVENEIEEGVTVREDEPVFSVPDPTAMRVVVNVNESKVAYLHPGVPALVRVEAFADEVLRGHVLEVTAIPTPAAGPFSDVKMYNATVEIEKSLYGLRTGMNARVEFLVADRENVVRVPVKTLRWFDGTAYVALPSGHHGHTWKPVKLGMMNEFHAEVRSGLEPGDQVLADPSDFAPPTSDERQQAQVASRTLGPSPG